MNLASAKQFLFHHGEKLLLAAVVLFVAKVVYSYATALEVSARGHVARGQPGPPASAAIKPYADRAVTPYVAVPDATAPLHDWFHPPRIRRLAPIQLDPKKKRQARVALGARAVAPPQVVSLTTEDIQILPRLKSTMSNPCQVLAEVDPRQPDTVVLTARGTGNWRKFEVRLENEDRAWLYVVVAEPEDIIQSKVAPPKVLSIGEEPLGVVRIKFTIPTGEVRDEDRHTVTKYLEPTHFLIYRKSEFNAEFREVGRVEVQPPESEPGAQPPAPGAAPGLPGLPPRGPAPRRRPLPQRTRPTEEPKAPEFEFVDRSVESETYYVYKIVSVRPPEGGIGEAAKAESPQMEYQTKAKFTFAYTGGGATKANIVVFIGSRENPQDYKRFQVKIGQRIGTMPPELRKSSATEKPTGEGTQEPEAEAQDTEYVTRFVLVDIVPRAFRVVPQVRRVAVGRGLDGRVQFKEVVAYREEAAKQVILRDRRNRLLRLWFEHEQSVIPPAK